MADIIYIHWNEEEAKANVQPLLNAGHKVRVHWSQRTGVKMNPLPGVLVISLDRLPSHGKAVAEWFWEAKRRQSIPLVFAGGQPEKVAAMKAKFPKATFCAANKVAATASLL